MEFVTIQSIIDKLKARAPKTPPGTWVTGYYYDDTKVKEGRPLTNKDLDKVSTDHPVVVIHRGGHTSFYNSKAMAMAGLTKNTPVRFGGTFDKDARGELNGRVTDNERDIFNGVGKRRLQPRRSRAARGQRRRVHIKKIRRVWSDQRVP